MGTTLHLSTVDSTNRYASEHFDTLGDGTLVSASVQTAGRGRLDRNWHSPLGNVYASYVMKEPFGDAFRATMVSSLSVIAAVRDAAPGLSPAIKWPNDIFIGAKKLCGILCEGVVRGGTVSGIICGIGVNVNMSAEETASVGQPATSLRAETGKVYDLEAFVEKLRMYLDWYYAAGTSSPESLYRQWKAENSVIGHRASFVPPDGHAFFAFVRDIEPDGRLVVEREGRQPERFTCGDVKLCISQPEPGNRKEAR